MNRKGSSVWANLYFIKAPAARAGLRHFDNKATNLQSVALVTAGEGLHNNHHQYPTSACLAVLRGEIDPAWPVIRALEFCGLAHVKRVGMAKAA